jgi:hypothetical protein
VAAYFNKINIIIIIIIIIKKKFLLSLWWWAAGNGEETFTKLSNSLSLSSLCCVIYYPRGYSTAAPKNTKLMKKVLSFIHCGILLQ